MILSDLAKYSMTRSGAQSLCDSWASCSNESSLGQCRLGRMNLPSWADKNELLWSRSR